MVGENLMAIRYADRIRELRSRLRLSQENLAELTNISQVQISRYERGINSPTGEALLSLADALNTSTDYILGKTDDPSPFVRQSDLTDEEIKAILAWRRGDRAEAARIILNG